MLCNYELFIIIIILKPKQPGSIICFYVMFVSPHIICVHVLSVTNKMVLILIPPQSCETKVTLQNGRHSCSALVQWSIHCACKSLIYHYVHVVASGHSIVGTSAPIYRVTRTLSAMTQIL